MNHSKKPRSLSALLIVAIFSLVVCAPLVAAPAANPGAANDTAVPAYDAQSAFELLKSFAGEWQGTVATTPDGEGRQTTIVYKVSAAGHSVIETFAPGSPYEMFSVYHMDGDQLLMTHYCAIGNQPRMRFEKSKEAGELIFAFDGGSNMDPAKDAHAHEGRLRYLGPDELETQAIGYSGGQPSRTQYFKMRRVAP